MAWLRVDTQTVLTIGTHVITKNPRVAVSRPEAAAWALTVRGARRSDAGAYMCQVNREPMIHATHHLQVVVPPDITAGGSGGEVRAREGEGAALHCSATGVPPPSITWRREDAAAIHVNGNVTVNKWSGEWLNLSSVSRESDGAYLCIATNGVPPSVSKRIILHVLCAPSVFAKQKMIGGYVGSSVSLQCRVEANPRPAVYWTHSHATRLQYGSKYQASMRSEGYRHWATLQIHNVSRDDIGAYTCLVENALGKGRADITLYTLASTTTSTMMIDPTTDQVTTTLEDYLEISSAEAPTDNLAADLGDEDPYVVVLSQHQMQSFDPMPSS